MSRRNRRSAKRARRANFPAPSWAPDLGFAPEAVNDAIAGLPCFLCGDTGKPHVIGGGNVPGEIARLVGGPATGGPLLFAVCRECTSTMESEGDFTDRVMRRILTAASKAVCRN